MFTGLVAAVGRIVSVKPLPGEEAGVRLSIDAGELGLDDVAIGDSIAVQGACMTVIELSARGFAVDVSRESLNRTVGLEREGEVNLEKSLGLGDKLGGHLVSGHVDGLGEILRFSDVGESRELVIAVPKALARFLAYKGSITVNGISLTVNRVEDTADGCEISINIIPHTQAVTTLRNVKAGDKVNLEIDMIARYVERMLSASGAVEGRAPAWL
ncbi:riboflavin synthase [Bordetella pseudohinzii]|uniref:Riboflavin synthase n=1 Tax=Bordetella pseudohinzii TaxID=1331258 RepID=A0A0J6F047_9BORD|nr:riboflavin synthase [Bordetella pseudohinzii]ANY14912.1 riboflavin synthase subunit alpha [Bordetella pseudohinzii]KMM25940.1 riboflavin synthase subunit alpha [Bordetella pseudohinzii]KXA76480.1 riboflavin synthase subunit alpha [Bordetella pseudohinzii]KXA79293.1 riboflavin synthase subunit alpha [Bordetella pseudohinzii]CUI94669.1 Riboflavin synthase alpha chain [Bordetella pseudohinzii]